MHDDDDDGDGAGPGAGAGGRVSDARAYENSICKISDTDGWQKYIRNFIWHFFHTLF